MQSKNITMGLIRISVLVAFILVGCATENKYVSGAAQGNAKAQNNLGISYYKGEGVKQDYVEAVKWYRLAADQGNPKAQYNMGISYYRGEGVKQDYVEAVKWFKLAAVQNDSSAQLYLGISYYEGSGVPKNLEFAIEWIQLAANIGDKDAQKLLNLILKERVDKPNYLQTMAPPASNSTADIKEMPKKTTSVNLDEFKAQCKALGFKAGTQDFGNCVLQLNESK